MIAALSTRLRLTLEMIRFSHSVFALPFALLSLVVACDGLPPWRVLGWVLVAMVAARSAAMAFNRIADRDVDAENPRTEKRHLVTGSLSLAFAWGFTLAMSALFVLAAAMLNATALALSPVVLAVLLGYSYLKRMTVLAHFGVGLALGLSPWGAWIAGTGGFGGNPWVPSVLGLGVVLWVAGFDVIYACQDVEADRRLSLFSIPARIGVERALKVAAILHALAILAFAAVAPLAGLTTAYVVALVLAAGLLAYEHRIVSPKDLTRVNVAFFTVNGVVAIALGACGIADVLLR